MHYRHDLHLFAVFEEVTPGLDPMPVRGPEVISLHSSLRKVVVQAAAPDDDDIRAEFLKHIEECRGRLQEVLPGRCHSCSCHRDLDVVVEGDTVPEQFLIPVGQSVTTEEGFREFRIRILVRLMLRMRVIQIFYHSYSEVSRSVGGIAAVMGLAEGEDAFAGKAGGVVMFPYPGKEIDWVHGFRRFLQISE